MTKALLLPVLLLPSCDPSLPHAPTDAFMRVATPLEGSVTIDRAPPTSTTAAVLGVIGPSPFFPESARTFPGIDTDGDGLYDAFELDQGLDPLNTDTDGDGIHDHWDLLGSQHTLHDPTYTGGFAWFDLSVTTFDAPSHRDAGALNVPLTGIYLNTVGERTLVAFGPQTHRPVHSTCTPVGFGPPECGNTDSRSEWGVTAHAVFGFEPGPLGMQAWWQLELFDGTSVMQDHQRLQPQTAPTGGIMPEHHWGPDPDADGLSAEEEFLLGTDPQLWDTDSDGIPDGVEHFYGQDPMSPDTDSDGITDAAEYLANTDPADNDPDQDTLTDSEEERLGTSATRSDTDRDGLNDNLEVLHGTNPNDWDTNNDGVPDGQWLFTRPRAWALTTDWSTFTLSPPHVATDDGFHLLIQDTSAGIVGWFIDETNALQAALDCDRRNSIITCYTDSSGSGAPNVGSTVHLVRTDTGVDVLFDYQWWPVSFTESSDDITAPRVDSDYDGLWDDVERQLGLNPRVRDTDADGITDLWDYLGSSLAIQSTTETGFGWFDLFHPSNNWPTPPLASPLRAPLFGVYISDVPSDNLVAFGPDTGTPLLVQGPVTDEPGLARRFVTMDVTGTWGDTRDLRLRAGRRHMQPGFVLEWELLVLQPGADGGQTETRLDYQVHVLYTTPTRRPPTRVLGPDSDADYLLDEDEVTHGTDPFVWDTDGDGVPDGVEVFYGHDPLSDDTDGDGTLDMDEYLDGTAD